MMSIIIFLRCNLALTMACLFFLSIVLYCTILFVYYKRNLFACLSGMAGHALYGMAPCFGHTGVTFDAEK